MLKVVNNTENFEGQILNFLSLIPLIDQRSERSKIKDLRDQKSKTWEIKDLSDQRSERLEIRNGRKFRKVGGQRNQGSERSDIR